MDTTTGDGMEGKNPELGRQIITHYHFLISSMNFVCFWSSKIERRPLRGYEALMYNRACDYVGDYFKNLREDMNGPRQSEEEDTFEDFDFEEYRDSGGQEKF